MLELFNAYFDLNKKQHNFNKVPITVDVYSKIVKLSVFATEFRDKLLMRKACPPLLGHSS